MEEKVPTSTPIVITRVNSKMAEPPKKRRANNTRSVVPEVRSVLPKVAFMARLITSENESFLKTVKSSRILSKIMMVSFRE